jgi:hypothetical protein
VNESGMIEIHMGMHNTSDMVAVLGTPCVMPTRKLQKKQLLSYSLKTGLNIGITRDLVQVQRVPRLKPPKL